MHYLYILLSEAKNKTYTGVADDVNKRLAEHNSGKVKSSRPYCPYKIIHTESFETLKEARQKERFYKSTTGRRRLKEMFFVTERALRAEEESQSLRQISLTNRKK
jgi:Predicted endonuclease containing a URI domain